MKSENSRRGASLLRTSTLVVFALAFVIGSVESHSQGHHQVEGRSSHGEWKSELGLGLRDGKIEERSSHGDSESGVDVGRVLHLSGNLLGKRDDTTGAEEVREGVELEKRSSHGDSTSGMTMQSLLSGAGKVLEGRSSHGLKSSGMELGFGEKMNGDLLGRGTIEAGAEEGRENGSDAPLMGASHDQVIHSDSFPSGTTGERFEVSKRDALSAALGIQAAVNQIIAAIAGGLFRAILLTRCTPPRAIFTLSDGSQTCLNTASDSSNCGSPGNTCPASQTCISSTCTSPAGGRFSFGDNKIRGVNLGGWLVAEAWITPSLFGAAAGNPAIVDEWTMGQFLGRAAATQVLNSHWDTWIREADLFEIASYGLNTVRIPIGYWAFDISAGEPYIQSNQFAYLLRAIGWAQNAGLKVIVDLHGAPGSQNGFDNSGRRGTIGWQTSNTNVARSLAVIQTMSQTFAQAQFRDTVTAIELLNEPAGFFSAQVVSVYKSYVLDGYSRVRNPTSTQSPIGMTFHDAFQNLNSWGGFLPKGQYQNVNLDTHVYAVFSNPEIAYSDSARIQSFCARALAFEASEKNYNTYVGEWAPATTDCAPNLNGQGIGSRYDGSFPGSSSRGSCAGKSRSSSTFSTAYKVMLRKMFEVQTSIYENSGSGWIMWTYKAENADDWSYKAGIAGGWIPRNPNEKLYGNQCT